MVTAAPAAPPRISLCPDVAAVAGRALHILMAVVRRLPRVPAAAAAERFRTGKLDGAPLDLQCLDASTSQTANFSSHLRTTASGPLMASAVQTTLKTATQSN